MRTQRDLAQQALDATQERSAIGSGSARTVYLNAAQVCARYGGVSEMTLWRWHHNEDLGFPKPTRINRLRYWKHSELDEWERTRRNPDGEAT